MAQDATSAPEKGTGEIPLNPNTLQLLSSLVASAKALTQAGYVLRPLTDDELEQKQRCLTCGDRSESIAILTKPDTKPDQPHVQSGLTAETLRSQQEASPRPKAPTSAYRSISAAGR
jgi:hypothetical protein